jgi:hypothetical protein
MLSLKKKPSKKICQLVERDSAYQDKILRVARLIMQTSETYFFMDQKMHYAFSVMATLNTLKQLPKPVPEYAVTCIK